jgi:hypothetical protein
MALFQGDRFVAGARLPQQPVSASLHSGYAALARYGCAGLVLMDDVQPAYLVTDDFIHGALMSEVQSLEDSRAVEVAALMPLGHFVLRWLREPEFEGVLTKLGKATSPTIVRIAPTPLHASSVEPPGPGRYGVYRTASAAPSANGWYIVDSVMSKHVQTAPVHYRCKNNHTNDDFDRGVCIVSGCGEPLITRP